MERYVMECMGLTKTYGRKTALDKVDLKIESGRIIGLLGPNGSGKTTLIKLACGLLSPTSGEIAIDGHAPGVHTKSVVSYLPDRMYFADWMRTRDLLRFFADFYEDFDREKAEGMLADLGVSVSDRLKTMSKGTKEKVQLVLAMSRRAKLYLLDEPIGGVDPAAREFILRTILTNYSPEAALVISTHLIADIEKVLDEVIFLQNGRVVRQDVLPLFGQDGEPIAVLIREKDVSETLSQARKYQELARDREENRPETYGPPEGQSSQLVVREIHHRVKNNLQLVASLLNIQARQSQDPVLQKIFAEHTKRVLNIAAIHDMLTKTEAFDRIPLRALLGRITRELQTLVPEGKSIRLRVAGDDVTVSSDRATAVALVVNELLLNSLEHGYTERDRGTVTVSVYRGALYATVTVADDGCGFVQEGTEDSLGMTLVRMTVRDKLGGALRIQSAPGRGTVSSFDVRLEEN